MCSVTINVCLRLHVVRDTLPCNKQDRLLNLSVLRKLCKLCIDYNSRLLCDKTKIMVFCGKIVIGNNILQRVPNFRYLGYNVSFDHDSDTEEKINTFQNIYGAINRIFETENKNRFFFNLSKNPYNFRCHDTLEKTKLKQK